MAQQAWGVNIPRAGFPLPLSAMAWELWTEILLPTKRLMKKEVVYDCMLLRGEGSNYCRFYT